MRRYIYGMDERNRRKVLPDRYEFLLYRHLRHGLEAGDVFCRDSVRFRSMKDDLIDDKGPPVAMERKVALSDLQLFVSFLGNAERP